MALLLKGRGGIMKNKWSPPLLIVLVRGSTSEWVLGNCKYQFATGPEQATTGCMNVTGHAACRGHCKT